MSGRPSSDWRPSRPPPAADDDDDDSLPYNIIPIHNLLADHPSLRFPEVRAAVAALGTVGDLRRPPFVQWKGSMDILDWLGLFFGFQSDNVRNQREHLVLLLANAQMRIQPPPDDIDALDPSIVQKLRKKFLQNYTHWCAFLGRPSNIWISSASRSTDERRELLYVSLFLLIWGEAANLRFMPECLCYIFHHMAMELNRILEGYIDENTGQSAAPAYMGENAFLLRVVTPFYQTVKAEVDSSRNGTKPHSVWRNYDDINEYFWSERCFTQVGWPLKLFSNFFIVPQDASVAAAQQQSGTPGFQPPATPTSGRAFRKGKVGKTGFVEQRSFWNLFRSFDRLWIMHILFFQAAVLVAWDETRYPWQAFMKDPQLRVKVLSVFITWAGLRFLQSLLDAGMQYSLISTETLMLGVRMLMKSVVAAGWTLAFVVMYLRIWEQKNRDRRWSAAVQQREQTYYYAAAVFIAPEVLAVVLFVIPWVRNFVEQKNWKIFYVMTWWFQNRIFVGRGLREGILDNLAYTAFWALVLATKFAFSYFLQIKPMIAPTKSILAITNVQYRWHEFFRHSNRSAVVLLWAPVVIIYLMDISIWYSIYSSFTGALVGLFSHLGEIRNLQQLRLRFQFFASAMQFNLMPEEQHFKTTGTLKNKFQNAIRRLKLRYGFGKPYKRIESNQVEATKFALIWNEIIGTFREEDIISDQEVELLELPANAWNIGVVRWPCLLLCNELLLALGQASELEVPDRTLWKKICKNEYRRCAVTEAYDSVKFFLLRIVKEHTQEHAIVSTIFSEIDAAVNSEKLCASYNLKQLKGIHEKLIVLVKELLKKPGDKDQGKMQKVVNTLQTLYDISLRDLPKQKRSIDELLADGLVAGGNGGGLLFENAVEIPDAETEAFFYRQLRRLSTILTSRDSMHNIPRNLEARRRIAFFSNSLFMNMPRAPQVEKMFSFSVLTPYYDEDVMYTKEKLQKENDDGISTIFYLQKIFPDEWQNFLDRMKRDGMKDPNDVWTEKEKELRLWASYRGQTLARTVRGMMYYYKALKMLAFLDSASEVDVQQGSRELAVAGSASFSFRMANAAAASAEVSSRSASSRSLSREGSGVSMLFKGHEYGTASMKFTYVVSCQIYGEQKKKKDPRASDILYLMENNEALRIAYVDEVEVGREGKNYFSVLVKYDRKLQKEVEIYRVMLPGPMKLGEGKPENQNQSFIFTRGNAVQTIDMNQDNYFEEALKVRNLLEEYNQHYGIRKPTILGVREHIFTASVSSLAWFMSAQETSFVTLGQRVLAWPLKVRMHYGHPDVFDRLWFLSRGGISKASRVINISEDIFAGFNCTLRGGNVTHREYIQVGKGRDVGLNQISMFEAKVASGNGEQVLSRDVYRLGHRLDFLRMMSFYYTTVGFFFNTMMVVLTVYAFLWGRLYLCLSGIESSIITQSSKNKAFIAALNQQFIIQLGIFTALPMIVENSLEHGFLTAVWDFLMMQLQFASVFYSFSMGTRTHFFGRTILHGGAKYRATGRGFVVEHKKFAENYRLYARSHFIKAIELGIILVVYASYSSVANLASNTAVYILMMLSSWFLVVSWIMAPFMFNPTGFDWLKAVYDFDDFMNWIWFTGGVNVKADQSWEKWWYEEQEHLKNTGLWGKILEILLNFRYFFFQYGIVYQFDIVKNRTGIWVYLISWVYVIVVLAVYIVISSARVRFSAKQHIYYRAIQSFVVVLMVLVLVLLLQFTSFKFIDALMSLLAFMPTGWGLISIALVFRPLLEKTVAWNTVVALARLYDMLFGVIVMAPTALLSWLPGFQSMQTRILFNDAFSRGLHINRILTGKKSNADW